MVFTKSSLNKAVKYLLQNYYFDTIMKQEKRIVREIIGIPMASNPVLFFADLFLNYYESRWMHQ